MDKETNKPQIIWSAAADRKGLYFKDPCKLIPSEWNSEYFVPAGNQTLRWAQPNMNMMWLSVSLEDLGFKRYGGVMCFTSYSKAEVKLWIKTILEFRATFLTHMREVVRDVRSIHNNLHGKEIRTPESNPGDG